MNDKTLYLECYSGISGDMTVAALLDLGADQEVLLDGLKSLKVDGYSIKIGRREKNSISACDFDVILEAVEPSPASKHVSTPTTLTSPALTGRSVKLHRPEGRHHHDHHSPEEDYSDEKSHTHESFHNHEDSHTHEVSHTHDNSHTHEVSHTHDHIHLGHHEHRNLNMIYDIIDSSSITDRAKLTAKKIFYIVATAEAKAHGKPIEEVHFHEVGAIDSIVDIVATAICLDNLNIKDVIVSELHEGSGFIKCQHGTLPVPVPAVINISTEHKLPLHITAVQGELVTPTGAAIAAALRTKDTLPKEMTVLKVGLGAGKRNYPNTSGILRALLIEDCSKKQESIEGTGTIADQIMILESNLDDCSGEALAYTMELLFKQGAKDVYYTPIFMKKNRPAYKLSVLCSEAQLPKLEEIIFTHTTTIGIRRYEAARTVLQREVITVITSYGEAQVKVCTYQSKKLFYPEYESVKQICDRTGQDYMSIYQLIRSTASEIHQ